ncbi:MAG: hypothetical protein ACI9IA_000480 [Enterobacterales bacterium]|jgi:hypothetical protein
MIHLLLHFLVPAVIASAFFRKRFKVAYLLMISTMLVDLDHFFANPIYDASRCSINFHPLHTFIPIGLYLLLCFPKKTRFIGIGLMIHMILDTIDCQLNQGVWFTL